MTFIYEVIAFLQQCVLSYSRLPFLPPLCTDACVQHTTCILPQTASAFFFSPFEGEGDLEKHGSTADQPPLKFTPRDTQSSDMFAVGSFREEDGVSRGR